MKMPPAALIPCMLLSIALTAVKCPPVAAADPSPLERLLVDFEDADAVRLTRNKTEAEIAKVDGGAALEISTDAKTPFPSVRIDPTAGAWDLRGYEAVTMEVRNPQDAPLRVLLNVNNPDADGRNGCNTASVTVGAGETGTLTVPFGQWHGEPRPIDLANITSFEILLDKPGRAHHFFVDNIRAVRQERFDLAGAMADPFFASLKPPLGRGINLGNALDAPREGEWGVTLEEAYFQAIKDAGFDSIRLPVRWSAHAAQAAPYAIDPKFFERIDWAVEQALSRGLNLVLNIHHYEGMDASPDENRARFVAIWDQIASRYRDRPPALCFELLNEPHDNLTAGKWNAILSETLAAVRKTNPTRTVVVGPIAWNGISELKSLKLPQADRNLMVTVHYYSPFKFTHQGAQWLDPKERPPAGAKWGSGEDRATVQRDFDTAALWGLKNKRPIFLGEFGVYHAADLEERVRWTKFVAEEAAKRKMGYAYWEFCSGFGAYDPQQHKWIEPLRDALVPASKK